MDWLRWLPFALSVILQVRLLVSLRRGAYRQYPFIFIYCLVLLITIIGEAAFYAGIFTLSKASKVNFFYRNDAIRQFLLFTVVVSLIERAMQESPYRIRVRVFLAVAAVLSVFLSLTIHSDAPQFSLWMTEVTRDLSFGSVGLTLLLWLMLISSQRKDRQLLMLTAGLGLLFTGEAIGQSLRQMGSRGHSEVTKLAGNLILSSAHLLRLYVWCMAFRRTPTPQQKKVEPGRKTEVVPHPAQTLFEANA